VAFVVHASLAEVWFLVTHKNGVLRVSVATVGLAYDLPPNGRNFGTGY
jgi:hypothetical protein